MNNPPAQRALEPYGYETWGEKFSRKFKENPWVPIGCIATVGALIMSAVKMRAGHSQHMNYWMRARVGLQGVTLVALVAGSMKLQAKRKEITEATGTGEDLPRNEATQEVHKAQQKAKEKDEFEDRLRGAEMAHSQEMGLVQGSVRGPTVQKHDSVNMEHWHKREAEVPAGQSSTKNGSPWKWWKSSS